MPTTAEIYASKDACALKELNAWSGSDKHLPVGHEDSLGYTYRSMVYFPISWTGMTGITSARMYLRAHRSSGGGNHVYSDDSTTNRTLGVYRSTSNWGEGSTLTEPNMSTTQDWNWNNTAGDYDTAGGNTYTFTTFNDGAWYDFDITSLVKLWAPTSIGGSGYANYGCHLKNNSSETNDLYAMEFYSSEQGSGYKPYIKITYTDNQIPTAPINCSPGGTTSGTATVLSGLTPTFTGLFQDPDSGDTITGVQVILYDGTTQVWDSGTVATTNAQWTVPYTGPALTGNKVYNWKARCKDAAGAWGTQYSSLLYIKPNSTPLAPVLALSESPTTDVLTLTPAFNVTHNDPDSSDNQAYGYQIVIQTSGGSPVADTGEISLGTPATTVNVRYGEGTLTGKPALVAGSSYRWQAKTKDANGAWSSLSGWATFTIHATAAPTNLSPTGNFVSGTLTPVFSGARGSTDDALTEVTVEIYRTSDLVNPYDSQVQTAGVTSTGFSFTWPRSLLNTTVYKWRAKVKTATFGYGGWSALQDFSIDTSGLQMTAPVGTAVNNDPDFTLTLTSFRWFRIEVWTNDGVTKMWDSGDGDHGSSVGSKTINYGTNSGTGYSLAQSTLNWATQYKWRAKVSNVSLSDLQGKSFGSYAYFTTDSANPPTLTGSAIGGAWITTANPVFGLTRGGTDTIATARVIVYRVISGVDTEVWDSGTVDVADGTTATITYGTGGSGENPTAEPALIGGSTYRWKAQYTKATGPTGGWSGTESFYFNSAPNIPTDLQPDNGAWINGINPVFEATFSDPDVATKGDYPTEWEIVITTAADAAVRTYSQTTSLNNGLNTWTYSGSPLLVKGTTYKWKTRFKDSKGVWGPYSSVRTLTPTTGPVGTITSPATDFTVATNRVDFTFDYYSEVGSACASYKLLVYRTADSKETVAAGIPGNYNNDTTQDIGPAYNSGILPLTVASGQSATVTMPSGYTQTGWRYRARLTVWDVNGVQSTTDYQPFIINVNAPPALAEMNVAPDDQYSRIRLDWETQETAEPSGFAGYRVYRRVPGDDDFTAIAYIKSWASKSYDDYYAGNGNTYEYTVVQLKNTPDDADLSSPASSIAASVLSADDWMVVGADRRPEHIFVLPVVGEDHQRPVQQEIFEPIGSDRKVIARGAVLGHEGNLECQWVAEETKTAREQTEYLYRERGPHILKSPFGEVFEVEFAGPASRYSSGGHLNMTLSYIETSQKTSDLG
jgi:hypothetical protein